MLPNLWKDSELLGDVNHVWRRLKKEEEEKKITIQRVKTELTSESFFLPFPWVNDSGDCISYDLWHHFSLFSQSASGQQSMEQ